MQEYYDYIKALHLIFIITWFSGLFYVVRLFVYQAKKQKANHLQRKRYL
jgi:putative membrane protein